VNFQWRNGFHAPKGVGAEDVGRAIQALPEASPEHLLQASSQEGHVLHETLWAEGDQVWARRGRLDHCRNIIGAVRAVQIVGGREIQIRAFENLQINGERHWRSIEEISDDAELRAAYLREIVRLQDQANAKLRAFQEFMDG